MAFPVIPLLVMAGSSFLGAGINAYSSNKNNQTQAQMQASSLSSAQRLAEEERAFNSAEAQKNRQWQEEMSNTAYQRQVADMTKAGLNPYLAYSQGGASVPSGSMASASGLGASSLTSAYSNMNAMLNSQTARDTALIGSIGNLASAFMMSKKYW